MELQELGEHRGGDPVVLVHGFAAAAFPGWVRTGWARELEAAGFRPLGVDLPGHGPDAGPLPPGTTREALVAGIGELVAAVGSGRPVPLVGYSLGAQLAWAAAARRPGIGALVLGGIGPEDHLSELGRALDGDASAGAAAQELTAALAAGADDAQVGRWSAFARQVGARPFVPAAAVPAQPALLFAGARDAWAAPAALARLRGSSAPTELLEVPGRGHVDVLTARAARRDAVAFLRRAAARCARDLLP